MNEDAEKFAHDAVYGGTFDDAYGDGACYSEIFEVVLQAMQWAYADAAKLAAKEVDNWMRVNPDAGDALDAATSILKSIKERVK